MSDNDRELSLIEKAERRLREQGEGKTSTPSTSSGFERTQVDARVADQPDSAPKPDSEAVQVAAHDANGVEAGPAEQAPLHPLPDVPPPPPDLKPDSDRYVELNLAHLREQGFVTAGSERTQVAEEFRMIKRPLLANAFGRGADLVDQGNLVMVTSAKSGEGKTFTAVNLAISIAMEMDKTVLLVDADVGRSRVHEILGTPMGPGLIDLLLDDKLDVGDVMIKTNIPKLRVVPMGKYHPHANELLASEDMLRLTKELAERYPDRMVIFDSPPLLLTSEASVLGSLLGQIVFVVESEKTLHGAVNDALALLDHSKPIGLVLNKMRSSLISRYAGYGYGYGYGYSYAKQGNDQPAQGSAA
ncbi:XrtA-associated tyrosine autokinase [Ectothiorhodospira variabilis]|uniref:XrtA-associated tyrosine autokinase n=1 Tax=Ectothiorhodospira variabilis TaxID=505694 RepID=UPI001EFBF847|nr:XrtA-associated tyrosine autokinase [Ectothiorhodospira variabilis]MCG5494780.1 XrtA-associated tyrosine autokinase [Ectothiorhodospira variabilis]MCG5504331.1 XrtA-associated tyrosine autokinase [Ectothiorhodospira variabilis]MCG5507486.1 XrtA-associated tyrosine autokinase [Ectothiorhodospira variabilis]